MEANLKVAESTCYSTDEDEVVSVLSQSLKRKLPASENQVESARQNPSSRTLQSSPDERDDKLVSG